MSKQHITMRLVAKYVALQLPALFLLVVILLAGQHWFQLPPWAFWATIALWVATDGLLFPFVWRSYDPDVQTAAPIGDRGIATQRLEPSGYIRVCGELWRAELREGMPAVEAGETVRVREIRGLTLLVEPEQEDGKNRLAQ